ncbi:hypothetical protein MtrunA17_Chr1g0182171 [Medicago truncatula]|uniref:Uncharacterized protein n=1 Tax=Medicago truncatula TaxID=3880 RepID=A0A396JSY1_MEDTR|nr:hypothetical protein MtrunA17_Chr1g0182171 [Medicago truncatula]
MIHKHPFSIPLLYTPLYGRVFLVISQTLFFNPVTLSIPPLQRETHTLTFFLFPSFSSPAMNHRRHHHLRCH